MSIADELQKLQQLYQSGAISEDEFAAAKAKLLGNSPVVPPLPASSWDESPTNPGTLQEQTNFWGFFLHLSVLAGFAIPIAGLIVPVMIWQLKKDELPGIDAHGKNAINWIISEIIYAAGCVVLAFVVIGFPLLIALGVMGVIFPIIAAIKANSGETWKYPLAISFLN